MLWAWRCPSTWPTGYSISQLTHNAFNALTYDPLISTFMSPQSCLDRVFNSIADRHQCLQCSFICCMALDIHVNLPLVFVSNYCIAPVASTMRRQRKPSNCIVPKTKETYFKYVINYHLCVFGSQTNHVH